MNLIQKERICTNSRLAIFGVLLSDGLHSFALTPSEVLKDTLRRSKSLASLQALEKGMKNGLKNTKGGSEKLKRAMEQKVKEFDQKMKIPKFVRSVDKL